MIDSIITPDTTFVINFSGGKDSSAMLALICDHYPDHQKVCVMADTGWEHLDAIMWSQAICGMFGQELIVVRNPNKDFRSMVRKKKMFPSSSCRQCTSDLKRDPIQTWIRQNLKGHVLNCMGLRASESPARAKKYELAIDFRLSKNGRLVQTWLPVLSWTDEQVFEYLAAKKIPLHPVYSWLKRFSCRVCIFMTPADLVQVSIHDPEAIQIIADLETEINFTMKPQGSVLDIIQLENQKLC